jgi:putative flippase GtrA
MGITDRQGFALIIKQFLKFGIVGVSNTLISLATYYLLVYLGIHYLLANITAFAVSVCNAYFWNSRYVFKKGKGNNAKPFVRTVAAYGSTFLLGTGLLYTMVGILGISQWVAPLISLCITIPLNFLLNRYWAFK